jgi:hypothetical protein
MSLKVFPERRVQCVPRIGGPRRAFRPEPYGALCRTSKACPFHRQR